MYNLSIQRIVGVFAIATVFGGCSAFRWDPTKTTLKVDLPKSIKAGNCIPVKLSLSQKDSSNFKAPADIIFEMSLEDKSQIPLYTDAECKNLLPEKLYAKIPEKSSELSIFARFSSIQHPQINAVSLGKLLNIQASDYEILATDPDHFVIFDLPSQAAFDAPFSIKLEMRDVYENRIEHFEGETKIEAIQGTLEKGISKTKFLKGYGEFKNLKFIKTKDVTGQLKITFEKISSLSQMIELYTPFKGQAALQQPVEYKPRDYATVYIGRKRYAVRRESDYVYIYNKQKLQVELLKVVKGVQLVRVRRGNEVSIRDFAIRSITPKNATFTNFKVLYLVPVPLNVSNPNDGQ